MAEKRVGNEDVTFDARTVGDVMTRERTKWLTDDIVRWFRMSKDSDQAIRSRKPISFRKYYIVMRPIDYVFLGSSILCL